LIDQVNIPLIVVLKHKVFNSEMFSVRNYGAPGMRVTLLMNPTILPYIDVFPISNRPVTALFKNSPGLKDTLPGVAHIVLRLSFQKLVFREIFGLENLSNKGLGLSNNSPPLFGQ
jgi:hypothetical protein